MSKPTQPEVKEPIMNTRTRYTGPRTRFTTPDGTYWGHILIPLTRLPEGDIDCPALRHAIRRVKDAAPWFISVRSASVSHGTIGSPMCAAVEVIITADDDDLVLDALAALAPEVGATRATCRYMMPTEMGSSSQELMVAWSNWAALQD